LNIAREVILRAMRREDAYPVTRRANGQEEIGCGDGSRWLVRAGGSVYGYDVTLGVADECWDVNPSVIDDGLAPAMLGRSQPQLLLTSTAHRRATRLMPDRIDVLERGPKNPGTYKTLGMVWGADVADDPSDPAVWKAAAPFWSDDYMDFIAEQWERVVSGAPSTDAREAEPIEFFRSQYLNIWTPYVRPDQVRFLLPGWEAREEAPARPAAGGVAVVDEARDGSRVGVLWLHGDRDVYYREVADVPAAAALAAGADTVIVGLSLVASMERAGLARVPVRFGAKESRLSTPLLMSGTGGLRHDHGRALVESGRGAVVTETEAGFMISVKGSKSDVLPVKLLGWALWHRKNETGNTPMIF
jgi:hypothetical protein